MYCVEDVKLQNMANGHGDSLGPIAESLKHLDHLLPLPQARPNTGVMIFGMRNSDGAGPCPTCHPNAPRRYRRGHRPTRHNFSTSNQRSHPHQAGDQKIKPSPSSQKNYSCSASLFSHVSLRRCLLIDSNCHIHIHTRHALHIHRLGLKLLGRGVHELVVWCPSLAFGLRYVDSYLHQQHTVRVL